MPNWVTNKLTITGREESRKAFMDAVMTGEEFDFEKLIPMPESLHIVSGSDMDACIYAALLEEGKADDELKNEFNKVGGRFALFNRAEERVKELRAKADAQDGREVVFDGSSHPNTYIEYVRWGRVYVDNFRKYGATTWYDWCCHNWGTKWGACDTAIYHEDGADVICFDTAWSPPGGIVDKMPEVMKSIGDNSLTLCWKWAEEQGFFGGIATITSEFTLDEYYEDDEDAFNLCREVIGYSRVDMEDDEVYEDSEESDEEKPDEGGSDGENLG